MIFTSQSGLTDSTREAAWDDWYLGHLDAMVGVPGIDSAQRFQALPSPGPAIPPPSLAMYSIASPAVFESEIYLRTRGMGPWKALIDPLHYRRNLFEGLDEAPVPGPADILVLVDRLEPAPTDAGLTWLRAVALDHSTPYRGIRLIAGEDAARGLAARIGGAVALYRPMTRRYAAP